MPALPKLEVRQVDGELVAIIDQQDLEALTAYKVVAQSNSTIASANADALDETAEAYNDLIRAGQAQRRLSEFRSELLEEERRAHKLDQWFYRGVIVLAGLVAVGL